MRSRKLTLFLAGITLIVLTLSLPHSVRDAYERGSLYVFSRAFFEDIPKRLAGPGRFRFLVQPTIAAVLGIGAGRSDARAGRTPYLKALWLGERRGELLREGFQSIVHLLLMGVLLDSVCQWLILGASYPGAALVVGPVLIAFPYAATRALVNRFTERRLDEHPR